MSGNVNWFQRSAVAAANVGVVLALASCGGGEQQAVDGSPTQSGAASAAAPNAIDPAAVQAEETASVPGHPDNEVRVGVASITVSGKLMELRLVLTPQYDEGGAPVSVFDMMGLTHWPSLLDRENLKQYDVVRDENNQVLESSSSAEAAKGSTVGYQTFFPAPEDKVTTLDVTFPNGWATFKGVPVTYED